MKFNSSLQKIKIKIYNYKMNNKIHQHLNWMKLAFKRKIFFNNRLLSYFLKGIILWLHFCLKVSNKMEIQLKMKINKIYNWMNQNWQNKYCMK